MSDDLLKRLHSLHKQATVERSHFYVGWCAKDAIHRIEELEAELAAAKQEGFAAGMGTAMRIVASIGYGKNRDVDEGHYEAFRAIEKYYADLVKTPTPLAELTGGNDE